jgi:hypothetical protein
MQASGLSIPNIPGPPPIVEEVTRIAAANKYVRWTNVENLSLLGSDGIVAPAY